MLAGQTQIMLTRAQYVEFWLHPLLTLVWGAPGELRFISKMGIELKWVSQGASAGVVDAEECLIQGFSKTVAPIQDKAASRESSPEASV